jgi:hypothetical protein
MTGQRSARMPTVILGLLLGLTALTLWCVRALDLALSLDTVVIVALVGSGVLLLARAMTGPGRNRTRTGSPPDHDPAGAELIDDHSS